MIWMARKFFAGALSISTLLAMVMGVAVAWNSATGDTPGQASAGVLSVSAYNAYSTGNNLYPTGNPIAVLRGGISNNTAANPGVAVRVEGANPGDVTITGNGGCVGTGDVARLSNGLVNPQTSLGDLWEVSITMPSNSPTGCQGALIDFTYTVNVETP
jgi:hypothetical protein